MVLRTCFAQHGHDVVLVDVSQERVEHALRTIAGNLDRQVKKGTLDQAARDATVARITSSTDLAATGDTQLVVEAVPERIELKRSVLEPGGSGRAQCDRRLQHFVHLNHYAGSHGLCARERVVGMHFMNPVPVMKLVEVIRGLQTSDQTLATVMDLARKLDKAPVEVNDFAGFVSNRVLMPMINEAVFCVMEGVAQPEAIDTVMKLGMNHPMGPLALADLIGLGHLPVDHGSAAARPGR